MTEKCLGVGKYSKISGLTKMLSEVEMKRLSSMIPMLTSSASSCSLEAIKEKIMTFDRGHILIL